MYTPCEMGSSHRMEKGLIYEMEYLKAFSFNENINGVYYIEW